jgi:hypothetical protein
MQLVDDLIWLQAKKKRGNERQTNLRLARRNFRWRIKNRLIPESTARIDQRFDPRRRHLLFGW